MYDIVYDVQDDQTPMFISSFFLERIEYDTKVWPISETFCIYKFY